MSKLAKLTEQEIMDFLHAIERGEETLTCDSDITPAEIYAGNVPYTVRSEGQYLGWKLMIFNDCGVWNYIDGVITPDGTTYDYGDLPDSKLLEGWNKTKYKPKLKIQREMYGIPGYLRNHMRTGPERWVSKQSAGVKCQKKPK